MTDSAETPNNVVPLPTKLTAADALRARINPYDCFGKIDEVSQILQDQWTVLRKNEIDALRLQVDIQFKKLAKMLPDLKNTEMDIKGQDGKVTFIIQRDHAAKPEKK